MTEIAALPDERQASRRDAGRETTGREARRRDRLIRFFSRISIRLLAFNVLLVFLPAFGILSLETYEDELLDYQERAMVQQGRVLAAALGGHGPLDGERAQSILERMNREFDARLRVVDSDFLLLADSGRLGPRIDSSATPPAEDPEIRRNLIYRFGNFLYQSYSRFVLPPEPPLPHAGFYSTQKKLVGPEIEQALRGGYGSATRRTAGQRSLTLFSALPVLSDGDVVGAVLVSKSTFQILGSLYELRLSTFQVILLSVLAAVVLTLLVSTTIVRPVSKLQREALAILDRRGRLKGRFKAYQRLDEIGDLSRALAELTRRLHEHLRFTESFASDVSHEFKNPLASIRTATDLLEDEDDPAARQRFVQMIQRDVTRLGRLLSAVRQITQIDARLDAEPTEIFDLRRTLERLRESYELRSPGLSYALHVPEEPVQIEASPDRIVQVLENLLDNATGFSPEGATIRIDLTTDSDDAVLEVADQGPGIPEENLETIFDRFFSYRPEGKGGTGHTGLGLAIARAIVEGAGGDLSARNGNGGGAVFCLRLPTHS
ncbi:MAG: ATP-binding protein [Thermoanaerobaculia bacterium]|nr:ATP-binding protein [Thermoanaerobaculia bacterium]